MFETFAVYENPTQYYCAGFSCCTMTCGEVKSSYKRANCCSLGTSENTPVDLSPGHGRRLSPAEGSPNADVLQAITSTIERTRAKEGKAAAKKLAEKISVVL